MAKIVPEEEWNKLTPGQKLENIAERSLDDCNIILGFDLNQPGLTPGKMKIMVDSKLSIIRAIMINIAKFDKDKQRLADARGQVFGEMAQEFKALGPLTVIDGDKK